MAILRKTKAGNTTKEVLARQAAQAVKSQPVTTPVAKTESKAVVIPQVKAGAMSVDLGPMIAKSIAQWTEGDDALKQQRAELEERDYTIASMITQAFVKASRADPSIDYVTALGKDLMAKRDLNAKLYILTGLKTSVLRGKAGQEVATLEWNPNTEVGDILGVKETDSKAVQEKKEHYRSNLATMFTKCQKAALWLLETKGVDFRFDKGSGTLMLSGPGVATVYGHNTVALNQKQEQPLHDTSGKDMGSTVKLKAKPSFTDIARRAAEAHGKVIMTRADSRPKQFDDAHAQIVHLCDMLVKALEKYSDPNDAAIRALESAASAIEETLA